MKKKLKFISFGFGVICISVLLGYLYTQHQVQNDLDILKTKIDSFFNKSETMTDGALIKVTGSFSNTNNKTFYLDYGGGYKIISITKRSDNNFEKKIITAGNLTYKDDVLENIGYGYLSNYRQSKELCYEQAYYYLLKGDDKEKTYTPNKYYDLLNFPSDLKSNYHFIYSKHSKQNVFGNNTKETGNKFWSITTYTEIENYQVGSHDSDIEDLMITNMILFMVYGIILYLVILVLIKLLFSSKEKDKAMFNKNWKSIQNNSILLINKRMLGKPTVSIIEDGKTKKGIAKITDKRTSLQLSFEDQVYFYKIILLTPMKLELENLITSTILKYELLGSNAYSQSDNNVDDQITMPLGEIEIKNNIIKNFSVATEKAIMPTDDNIVKDKLTQSNETTKSKEFTIKKKWVIAFIISLVIVLGFLLFYIIYSNTKETSTESTNSLSLKQTNLVKKESKKNITAIKQQDTTEIDANTNKKIKIGDIYAGGIVFYIDKTGKHGKVCSSKDQSTESNWYNAKQICSSLKLNGYTDWYLPSISELYSIYKYLHLNKIGNFDSYIYWSSSETDNNWAWARIFSDGDRIQYDKNTNTSNFRAVRAF